MTQEQEQLTEEVADGLSGEIGAILTSYLVQYALANPVGRVFNADTDFELPGIGKRRPDVAFCSFDTLPESVRTIVPFPPDLAIEVASSRDEIDNTDKKLLEYQRVKVKLVWVIRPVRKVVEVYKNGEAVDLLGTSNFLEDPDLLPGFKLQVSKLFELPKRP